MSQYVNFYVHKGDTFISIGTYCRGSTLYDIVERYAPYEKLTVCDKQMIRNFCDRAEADKQEAEDMIAFADGQIEVIEKSNNSIDEKMDAFTELLDHKRNIKNDLIDPLDNALHYFYFLLDIVEDNEDLGNNVEVVFGIECYSPSVDSIER